MIAPSPRCAAAIVALAIAAVTATGCDSSAGGDPGTSLTADEVDAALAQGVEAQSQGRVDVAEEQFTAVVESDPGNRVAWFNLGLLRRARGDVDGAIDAFSQLVDADPGFALARQQRAITYQAAGDFDAAVADLRIVVDQEPSNVDARRQLGSLLVATGETAEGLALLDETMPTDG